MTTRLSRSPCLCVSVGDQREGEYLTPALQGYRLVDEGTNEWRALRCCWSCSRKRGCYGYTT